MPRRGFLAIGAMFVAIGAVLSVFGRLLGGQAPATAGSGVPIAVPQPSQTVPPVPAGADLGIPGVTPLIIPNADFYQIDTRLGTPHIDAATWSLRIHGMVDREVTLNYQQLLAHAARRALHHDRVRLQRGRRPSRGQCQVDGRQPQLRLAMAGVQAGCDPTGRSFVRPVDGRFSDGPPVRRG